MKPRLGIERGDGSTITFSFDDVPVFFKMDEAKKRGITGRDNNRISSRDNVGKAISKFLYEEMK